MATNGEVQEVVMVLGAKGESRLDHIPYGAHSTVSPTQAVRCEPWCKPMLVNIWKVICFKIYDCSMYEQCVNLGQKTDNCSLDSCSPANCPPDICSPDICPPKLFWEGIAQPGQNANILSNAWQLLLRARTIHNMDIIPHLYSHRVTS
jgi:hypothetical protein